MTFDDPFLDGAVDVLALPRVEAGGFRLVLSPTFSPLVVVTGHVVGDAREVECTASRNAESICLGRRGLRGFSADAPVERSDDVIAVDVDAFDRVFALIATC